MERQYWAPSAETEFRILIFEVHGLNVRNSLDVYAKLLMMRAQRKNAIYI
jgi:hypothetical protein